MFMDRTIAPINVDSISYKMFTKHDSRNTQLSVFFFFFLNKKKCSTSHDGELVKTFPLMYQLLM